MEYTEQRQHRRFSLTSHQVTISTQNGEDSFSDETIANIGSGGAFVITDRKIPLTAKIQLEFTLALEDLERLRFILSMDSLRTCLARQVRVLATGIVIRVEEKGIAVIFDTDYRLVPLQPAG